MRCALRCLLLLLPSLPLAACSLIGIGDQTTARCQRDSDCEIFTRALGDDNACTVFLCEALSGQCLPSTVDRDGDGDPSLACGGDDCDDSNPAIGPRAREVCGNDVDEDCSGEATDLDCDGVDACAPGSPPVDCDCDDLNANVSPLVGEECNGVDDDCDGRLDAFDEDDDGDGHADFCALSSGGAQDCDDEDESTYVGAPELCDGYDNDCFLGGELRLTGGPQLEPTEDFDGDGHAWQLSLCRETDPPILPKDDCDDLDPRVFPGAVESCDGVDEDCDGLVDEAEGGEVEGSLCWPASVDVGGDQSCITRADGAVLCWGAGSLGAQGETLYAPQDARVIGGGVWAPDQLATGDNIACALTEAATEEPRVTCWGLVYEDWVWRPVMSQVRLFGRPLQIDAGSGEACAVLEGGSVHCWSTSNFVGTEVAEISDAVELSLGGTVSCALLDDGRVHCWGFNDVGQLGDPSLPNLDFYCPGCPMGPYQGDAVVVGIDDATEVACGGRSCCALRAGGEVWCWGDNRDGQLGCEGEVGCGENATPARVAGLSDVTRIWAGGDPSPDYEDPCQGFACALRGSGELWCWGSHAQGQLGVESVSGSCASGPCATTPVAVSTAPDDEAIVDLSLGAAHGCLSTASGRVRCWGRGDLYQLGTGVSTATEPLAVAASALVGPLQIEDDCFRLYDGELRCADGEGLAEPEAVRNVAVAEVSVGGTQACVVLATGRVRCWPRGEGFVDRGQLGRGGGEGALVIDLTDAVRVSCGEAHCCALRETGRVACWGENERGQLGVGDGLDDPLCEGCSSVPVPVEGLSQVLQIAAGGDHSCALSSGGEVHCWGDNSRGQVGGVGDGAVPLPNLVSDLPASTPVVQLAASRGTTCAVLRSGAVLCLGEGFDAATGGAFPWVVPGLFFVEEVAMTEGSLCARDASGAVWCRGAELFDPSTVGPARELGCGPGHCCATRTSGQAVCWGVIPAGLAGELEVTSMTPLPVVGLEGSTTPIFE